MIKSLPAEDVVRNKIKIAVRKAGHSFPNLSSQFPAIVAEITIYLIANFDPLKRRAPPETSRLERESRNDKIIDAYIAGQKDNPPLSKRQLAIQSGLSASQICRILENILHSTASENGPNSVIRATRVIKELMPKDGVRAVKATELSELLEISGFGVHSDMLFDVLQHVETAAPKLHFYSVDDFVVISRGRRLGEVGANTWLKKARPSSFLAPRREFLDHECAVWRDLLAAQAVCLQQASVDDWRVFIRAFTIKSVHLDKIKAFSLQHPDLLPVVEVRYAEKLVCDDPEALVTRVRTGLTHRSDTGYTHSIGVRNQDYLPWGETLGEILYWIEYCDGRGLEAIAQLWTALSCYRARAQAGLLPGRNALDILPFMEAAAKSDSEGVPISESLDINRR